MSNKAPKLESSEYPKQIAVGMLMLVGIGVGAILLDPTDNEPASQELGNSPLDHLIDFAEAVKTTVVAWAPVAVYALAGVAGVLALVLVAARQARTLLRASVRLWWLYRRQWARVLDQHGLLVKDIKGIHTPKLGKMRSLPTMDVMQVRMPQGQEFSAWQEAAQPLARSFGAFAGFVSPDNSETANPYRDIVVGFARGRGGDPRMLPSAAEMAALPIMPGYTRRPVTIRLNAWALILAGGSMQIDDGQTIRRVRLWGRRWQQCLILPAT